MPKIRKETSNRKSTNDRAKLRKKIKETKRKKTRDAKKSVQWKSRVKKDPGIPSEFPYKDQILAEVTEQRRLAAEEKEKKKADKQRALAKARALARGEPWESEDEEDNAQNEDGEPSEEHNPKDLNVGAESIASLSAKFLTTELKPRPHPTAEIEEEDEEDEEVPVLINRDLPNLKSVLEKADVVIEVLDGRDPLAFRSKHVEQLATEMSKKVLFVLSKIDTCPREAVASWSQHLRTQQPTLLFRAASSFLPEASVAIPQPGKKGKGKAKVPTDDALGADSLFACIHQWAKDKKGDEPLVLAVVGVTNVGKSSLINSLLKRAALPVYTLESSSRGPTTTTLPQEVTLEIEDHKIIVIDTPGLSFTSPSDGDEAVAEHSRARDILLRNKGRIDRLKDANPPITHIVSRANTEDLMLMYSLPAFAKGDPNAFLSGVARANQLVKKKGELDLIGAARVVLRDWSIGKISHYTIPPSTSTAESVSSTNEAFITELYTKDESILSLLPMRKEKRKAGGLVKLSPGAIEERAVVVEEGWAGLEDSEDEEDDDDEQGEANVESMDVDQEDEEDEEDEDEDEAEDGQEIDEEEEDEEEELAPPPTSNKQKRKRVLDAVPAPERPAKKVAFAPSSKQQSRSAKRAEKKQESKCAGVDKPSKEKSVPTPAAKSALKTSSSKTTVSKKAPSGIAPAPIKKAANVASAKKAKIPATKSDVGPETYDFGKFF